VIGTGGESSTVRGEVFLQVVRPDRPGGIARVQAHEDVDGYAENWSVTAHAICADRPNGYEVVFAESELPPGTESRDNKSATAICPANKHLFGSGAAVTNVAPANVNLQAIYPSTDERSTLAVAIENTPTDQNWDFIVASSVCAHS
jgi:hypothetical protein